MTLAEKASRIETEACLVAIDHERVAITSAPWNREESRRLEQLDDVRTRIVIWLEDGGPRSGT